VVADVGDGGPIPVDPVPHGRPTMWDGTNPHLGVADGQIILVGVVKLDLALQVAEMDGEVRRPHEVPEHVRQRPLLLDWPINIEASARAMNRREERQALYVVPMDVGDQRRALEGLGRLLGVAETTQAGAEVEDDRWFILDLEGDAGSVAPVSPVSL